MIYFLSYDITDNKARRKVTILCKKAGMYRVQLSVYAGKLSNTTKNALWTAVQPYILSTDKCFMFRIGIETLLAIQECGDPIDKDLIAGKVTVMIF